MPNPTHFPPDFDTFRLPPSVFEQAAQEDDGLPPLIQLNLLLASWHQEHGALPSLHTVRTAGQPAEPSRPGVWSTEPAELAYRELAAAADPRLSTIESLDLGLSGHAWARQELDSGNSSPMAQPCQLTRLQLLQRALGEQRVEPSVTPGNDAAEAVAEIAQRPGPGLPGAFDVPAMPAADASLNALDALDAPEAPMTGGAALTLEAVLLEEAAQVPMTHLAALLGTMALPGLIGLHPAGDFSGL